MLSGVPAGSHLTVMFCTGVPASVSTLPDTVTSSEIVTSIVISAVGTRVTVDESTGLVGCLTVN